MPLVFFFFLKGVQISSISAERRGLPEVAEKPFVELPQGEYPADNLEPSLLEGLARLEFVRRIANLYLVEATRSFFSVTADKRYCAAFVYEGDDRGYLARLYRELGGDLVHNGDLVDD